MSGLHPVEPEFEPLAVAIGRAVLGAAALEKVLLVDIARRHAGRDGPTQRLREQLSYLERRPAGVLLDALKELDLSDTVARRVEDVVMRRNRLVHRFMEDPQVMSAFVTGRVDALIEWVDDIAVDCQGLINDIAPAAVADLEQVLGASEPDLMDGLAKIDPTTIDDPRLRKQVAALQQLPVGEIAAMIRKDRLNELD